MSNDIVIKVEKLSKRYRIGLKEEMHDTLGGALASWIKSPFSNFRRLQKLSKFGEKDNGEDIIWALKDVSFDVKQGEVVGIIGRNGAGKSTLLKILSRITEPTSGRAVINGRVSSLLEVGTGFHPELTGRENIYLNGTILGMSKKEVDSKFDEIVAFSEIGKFLDTPVKRYSSGMGVRLAFSVAAHLEPEILLVDEVLAVGDTAFQKKCLGKMEDVSKEGKTVLFVSHNLATLSALCSRIILLESGIKLMDDIANKTIERYLASMSESTKIPLSDRKDREGTGRMRFTDAWVEDDKGNRVEIVCSGQNISIVATYESGDIVPIKSPHVSFLLKDSSGNMITNLLNESAGFTWMEISTKGKIKCYLPKLPLSEGSYYFSVNCIINGVTADWIINAGKFIVESGDFFGTGKLPKKEHGNCLFNQIWAVS